MDSVQDLQDLTPRARASYRKSLPVKQDSEVKGTYVTALAGIPKAIRLNPNELPIAWNEVAKDPMNEEKIITAVGLTFRDMTFGNILPEHVSILANMLSDLRKLQETSVSRMRLEYYKEMHIVRKIRYRSNEQSH